MSKFKSRFFRQYQDVMHVEAESPPHSDDDYQVFFFVFFSQFFEERIVIILQIYRAIIIFYSIPN